MKHLIKKKIKFFILYCAFTISFLACEGFLADTLVKTGDTYGVIQERKSL